MKNHARDSEEGEAEMSEGDLLTIVDEVSSRMEESSKLRNSIKWKLVLTNHHQGQQTSGIFWPQTITTEAEKTV